MNIERSIANSFKMDEQTWLRHANPWSVLTRFTVLPLLILAIWSRVWWDWFYLLAIAIALWWMWFNPRVFSQPKSTNNWASKAVLGERVWINRDSISVPQHHQRVPSLLNLISASGLPFLVLGLVNLEIYPTLIGYILITLGKLWFIDRMVWLYKDMQDNNAKYRSWLY